MYTPAFPTILLSATAVLGLAVPGPDAALFERAHNVNPNAITNLTCLDKSTTINDHEINVALLAICGGISGKIEQCGGSPTETTGANGQALFTLTAQSGTIDISKGRWEGCVRAARAVCGDSPFTATCIGGANVNSANVDFKLEKTC